MKKTISILLSTLGLMAFTPLRAETCGEHCKATGNTAEAGCPMMGGHERQGCSMKGGHERQGCSMKGMGEGGHGSYFLSDAKELGLSDDQIVKLVKLRNLNEEKSMAAMHKVFEAEATLEQLVHEKKVDRKKVEEKILEIGKLKSEVEFARVSSMLDAGDVLNDKQKAKLFKGDHE